MIVPTIGRVVWYVLSEWDAVQIHKRRGQAYHGNEPEVGAIYPAIVVRVWGDTPDAAVNLHVLLDGQDSHWASLVSVGIGPRTYQWMPYQVGQAKKHAPVPGSAADVPLGSPIVSTSSGDHI